MSSSTLFPRKHQNLSLGASCISIAISTILVLFYTILYSQKCSQSFGSFNEFKWSSSTDDTNSATNISHIKFILASSQKTLKSRKPYIESWWQPNRTRGNIFLDSPPPKDFLPWPSSYPPFQVNEEVKKLRVYPKLVVPAAVRLFRSILETFRLGDDEGVRWYVMGDDDTVFFVENLVEVLGKYDESKHYYIGMTSEAVKSNFDFSFDMAYGGAGYALSYSLVKTLVPVIDDCIERYLYLRVSDQLLSFCLADLGVDLTTQKGFHQIDLLGDISGLLSSHPQSHVLSLHHLDGINPIFPSKNQYESINHLMKAAKFDQSRLLQQTICYHKPTNWSFTLAWGYSAHVYETMMPRSFLRRPLETFQPFKKSARPPLYMFNTRWPWADPSCQAAHSFFLDFVERSGEDFINTTYRRASPRNLPPCSASGNHSAEHIEYIRVVLQATRRKQEAKVECCDVEYVNDSNVTDVKLRPCINGEVIA
ncbi:hypothetical protein F3Y22_tig00110260pilonHSYRG00041 [Hibiscus syriacus]|uniref:Uncharacterized protein n=1 Tax=Hibiscus syriacus TaxID=106335 RepID=A0A6A3B736_HIBSY|nr:uncharacterized protein LOC120115258 [Hibiscus syriacus]KAE8712191.1 hypothetical protein F3Y22_tig00110260pilonHSYRG00041 [Hibiscus syriacus]